MLQCVTSDHCSRDPALPWRVSNRNAISSVLVAISSWALNQILIMTALFPSSGFTRKLVWWGSRLGKHCPQSRWLQKERQSDSTQIPTHLSSFSCLAFEALAVPQAGPCRINQYLHDPLAMTLVKCGHVPEWISACAGEFTIRTG